MQEVNKIMFKQAENISVNQENSSVTVSESLGQLNPVETGADLSHVEEIGKGALDIVSGVEAQAEIDAAISAGSENAAQIAVEVKVINIFARSGHPGDIAAAFYDQIAA